MTKPWIPVFDLAHAAVPAQLGVFQLAGDDDEVLYIGFGGGREQFGLRTAVAAAIDRASVEGWGPPVGLRYEVTHAYLSRWQELLMVHVHDTGLLPPGNPVGDQPAGRLRPGPAVVGH